MREAAIAASPVTHVMSAVPPFLIQLGTHDRLVPIEQSRVLHKALLAAGARSTLQEIGGADHCFWRVDHSSIMTEVTKFLDRFFARRKGWEPLLPLPLRFRQFPHVVDQFRNLDAFF
jgi:acetyl esterase/lipase